MPLVIVIVIFVNKIAANFDNRLWIIYIGDLCYETVSDSNM
jgi:hypothetical protein